MHRGYLPSNLLPMFQKKIAYGNKKFPWSINKARKYNYKKGTCPVAEELYFNSLICFEMCRYQLDNNDLKKLVNAFNKIFNKVGLRSIINKKKS